MEDVAMAGGCCCCCHGCAKVLDSDSVTRGLPVWPKSWLGVGDLRGSFIIVLLTAFYSFWK